MPRLNLTDEEARIIHKRREDERFYRSGWNAAITKVQEIVEKMDPTHNELLALLPDLIKENP
jgi:hypothetical protein